MDDFERKWELIREQLRIQATGDAPPRISSGRTLFGIRSEAEEKMERFAREIEEEARERRLAARAAEGPGGRGEPHGAENRDGRESAGETEGRSEPHPPQGHEPAGTQRPERDHR